MLSSSYYLDGRETNLRKFRFGTFNLELFATISLVMSKIFIHSILHATAGRLHLAAATEQSGCGISSKVPIH